MRGQYLEYQVRDQMVKTISESVQNGGQDGGQKKRENTLTSLAPALLRIENFREGQYLEYQVRDQMVKTISELDKKWRPRWRSEKAGKHINVSRSRIITNGELS